MPLFTSEYVFSDDYPTIEPSLKLDFANARALDPRITFTRASTATYVGRDGLVKYAGDDEPRFDHDPTTGESLGLLIEESRANYQDYSVDINTGRDFLTGSTLTANAATAPDGTTTATRITGSGVDEDTRLGWNTQATSNTQYNVFSVFVKADSGTPILGFYSNTFVAGAVVFNINLSDGSTNTINGASDFFSKVVAYPNGWYRVTVMGGPGTGFGGSWNINLVPSLTSARAASSGSNASASYLIWGVQEELATSSFPTSYIPTSGSTATRAVDDAVIQGENFNSFFNPSEGSIICKYKKDHWTVASGNIGYERVWEIGDGTDTNNLNIFNDPTQTSGNNIRYRVRTSSTNVFGPTTVTTGTNQTPTVALGYAKDNFVLVIDGTLVAADTSGDLPVVDRLHIGGRYGGDSFDRFNNTISKLFYYPKRITVAQLQTLTQ